MVEITKLPYLTKSNCSIDLTDCILERDWPTNILTCIDPTSKETLGVFYMGLKNHYRDCSTICEGDYFINTEYNVLVKSKSDLTWWVVSDIRGKARVCADTVRSEFWISLHLCDNSSPTEEDIINHLKSF